MTNENLKDETLSLHAGHEIDPTGSRAVPIYQTTAYVFKDTEHAANLFDLKEFGNIYTRLMNPTTDVFEKRIAALEGGTAAIATASGMSAIFLAIHNIAQVGDHIVSSPFVYGGTDTLFRYTLPRMGIETTFAVDLNPETIQAAIKPNTKAVYIESIGNPSCDVADIQAIADVAHGNGVPLIIDNTFAPLICKPFEYGADVVVHSCTKWIGGHGTSIGGVIIENGKFNWANGKFPGFTEPDPSYHGLKYYEALGEIAFVTKIRVDGMRNIGPCPSPFNSFQLIQGIETLPLRIKQHCANTLELAKFLQAHDKVQWVKYAGLPEHPTYNQAQKYFKGGYGAVLCFGIKGGCAAGQRFIDSVELASHLANVGDVRTLVIHPASTTHRQLSEAQQIESGINPEFIRVSVGLESIEDIIADFDQALNK
ncbi:MAG: O-acetylhomoserine aminocarboxypropyltransferase/cysteine synthase [Phycisphaerae bacterium]|nr:O-acetylhomoserine aminocarboxypropyltransferase/cysteine synthase [Phycisphaerae bacterium]